jgi:hypothetical protein
MEAVKMKENDALNIQTPEEHSAENPVEITEENPIEDTHTNCEENSAEDSRENYDDTTEENPEQSLEAIPSENTDEFSGKNPAEYYVDAPVKDPAKKPAAKSSENPVQTSGKSRNNFIRVLVSVVILGLLIVPIWLMVGNTPVDETDPEEVVSLDSQPLAIPRDPADEIIFTINGSPIPVSVFYYFLYGSFASLENNYMLNELDFNLFINEGMTMGQFVLNNSLDGIRYDIAVRKLAEEMGFTMADAEIEVDRYLASVIEESFGGDQDSLKEYLSFMGTTYDSFRNLTISQILGSQVLEYFYGVNGITPIDPEDYYDKFVTASNILLLTVREEYGEMTGNRMEIPLDTEEIEAKRVLAETIMKRLNNGEDFFELLNEYGEDAGVMADNNPEQAYTFQEYEKNYEFSAAAFAAEIGGYSDIIELQYGYSIVYRLPLNTDRVAEITGSQEFISGLFNSKLNDISVDYSFESTPQFDNLSLDELYMEYKDKIGMMQY